MLNIGKISVLSLKSSEEVSVIQNNEELGKMKTNIFGLDNFLKYYLHSFY